MTCLRVYFEDIPAADERYAWSLIDAQGRVLSEGRNRPSEWPPASEREAVLAAVRGRVSVVTLPPLPAVRVESAARFALDDRLASSTETSHIAVGPQSGNGAVRCVIVDRGWLKAFTDGSARCAISWKRIVLESDLAATAPHAWRWCARTISDIGFVRLEDASTIAVSASDGGALPEELAMALATSGGRKPKTVRVDVGGVTHADCDRWREATKIAMQEGSPWNWAGEASRDAINLLQPAQRATVSKHRALAAIFRPAAIIAGVALVLSLVGATGEWLWLHWQGSRLDRELASVAASVLPGQVAGDPAGAVSARYAELRHRAGLTVASDLLPLLSRASPVLGSLPPGTVRSLTYADRHLLLDLQKVDATQAAALQDNLQRIGLVAPVATTATGTRVRVGVD